MRRLLAISVMLGVSAAAMAASGCETMIVQGVAIEAAARAACAATDDPGAVRDAACGPDGEEKPEAEPDTTGETDPDTAP